MNSPVQKRSEIIGWFILAALICLLTGCGAGRTMVLAPPEGADKFQSAEISEAKSTVEVPEEVKSFFQEKLSKLLYGEDNFTRGPGLTIKYRFIQFNPGSQFTRWFWGGLGSAGKGSLTVEAKFLDQNGKELAKIHSEGEISSGAFGGSFDYAVEKAANEIAQYAKKFH